MALSNGSGKRRRILSLVAVIARDSVAHMIRVLLEHRFLRLVDAQEIARQGQRQQHGDDRQDHQQLDQREAGAARHHSRYGRPLMPVAVESENTSNTSSPSRGSSGGLR